jgi:hypothetical protein
MRKLDDEALETGNRPGPRFRCDGATHDAIQSVAKLVEIVDLETGQN